MAETSIEWATYTLNPWRGCSKCNTGCENCYAITDRSVKMHGIKWGSEKQGGTRVRLSDAGWKEPLKWNRQAMLNFNNAGFSSRAERQAEMRERPRVFCASLADVFEPWNGAILDHKGEQLYHCNFGYCTAAEVEHSAQLDNPCTMADLRADLFRLIDATPNLDWMLLTKRPENIRRMWPTSGGVHGPCAASKPPAPIRAGMTWYRKNVWLGASCSDQATFDVAWRELAKCTDLSPVRFFSLEPLIGPIDMHEALYVGEEGGHEYVGSRRNFFQLAIVGGESGPNARPSDVSWIRDIVAQCKAAEVACFVKQVGSHPVGMNHPGTTHQWCPKDPKGGDITEWPSDLQVRQMPNVRM